MDVCEQSELSQYSFPSGTSRCCSQHQLIKPPVSAGICLRQIPPIQVLCFSFFVDHGSIHFYWDWLCHQVVGYCQPERTARVEAGIYAKTQLVEVGEAIHQLTQNCIILSNVINELFQQKTSRLLIGQCSMDLRALYQVCNDQLSYLVATPNLTTRINCDLLH